MGPARQLKAFRSHNGHPPGAQDFTREGFKEEKSLLSGGKKRLLRQKTSFDRDNIKMGTISAFSYLQG